MRAIIGVLLAALIALPVQAKVLRFNFTGILTGVDNPHAELTALFGLPASVSAGQNLTISGYFEYDTDWPGVYPAMYPRGDFGLTINGVAVPGDPVSPDYGGDDFVRVLRGPAQDTFIFSAVKQVGLDGVGDGYLNQYMRLGFYVYLPTGTFSDDALPSDASFYEWPPLGFATDVSFYDHDQLDSRYYFAPLSLSLAGEAVQQVTAPAVTGLVGGLLVLAAGLRTARRRVTENVLAQSSLSASATS